MPSLDYDIYTTSFNLDFFSLSTSPGSKVCLLGNLTVQHGFVLLDSMNLKFLGGEVDHLRAKWEISKVCAFISCA